MRKLSLNYRGVVALSAVLPLACTHEAAQPEQGLGSADNVFGVRMDGLGVDIADCTAADNSVNYNGSTDTLTLDLGTDDAVVSVFNSNVRVNGYDCAVT